MVTASCPSSVTKTEGDDLKCVCRGKDGNPPANVTWYKGGVRIGESGKEEQLLFLHDLNRTDGGKYKCIAQSHTLTNEKSIDVFVYCKYWTYVMFIFMQNVALVNPWALNI